MITSNHEVILGDQPRKVEFDGDGNLVSTFEKEFKIEGKDSGMSAMVFLTVKGLVGDAEPIDVEINGNSIGKLMPNANAHPDSWFTQMLHFSAAEGSLYPSKSKDIETNTIKIPGSDNKGKAGKFYVQNIFVLYKAIFE